MLMDANIPMFQRC